MSGDRTKPRPSIDPDIAPFWDGVARGEFLLLRCHLCGTWYWPAAYCRLDDASPTGGDMSWEPASGRGTIFAFNVHHWAFDPGFKDEIPYVYALIELDEGPMFGTNVVGREPADLHVGDRVSIVFREVEKGLTLPLAEVV